MAEEIQDNAGVVAPPPLIYGGPLVVGLLIQMVFPIAFLPREVAWIIGASLIGLAFSIAVPAFMTMNRARTTIRVEKPTTALVVTGPFRYTRNPIYLSLTMLYVGIATFANALAPILLLPGVLWIMNRGVIAREERYLEQKFGEAYRHYKARVRRWL